MVADFLQMMEKLWQSGRVTHADATPVWGVVAAPVVARSRLRFRRKPLAIGGFSEGRLVA